MEAGEASGGDAAGETQAEALAVTPPQTDEVEREDGAGNEDVRAGAGARDSGAESERGEASPEAPPDTPAKNNGTPSNPEQARDTDVDPAGAAAPGGEISDSRRQHVDDGGKVFAPPSPFFKKL